MKMNVEPKKLNTETVEIGKRIEISVNGEFQVWDVVRPEEFSFLNKKISCESPLAKLIIGHQTGEEIIGTIAKRRVRIKIRDVYKTPKAGSYKHRG